VLGEVRGRRLVVGELLDLDLHALRARWRSALARHLAGRNGTQ
jgi:hypothetical protein